MFILCGCSASPFTGERIGTLKLGITEEQALSVAGRHDGVMQINDDTIVYKYLNRYVSGWGNNFTNYYLVFKNHKLIAIDNDPTWVDNSLSENLSKLNGQLQNQQIINQQNQYIQNQRMYQYRQLQLDEQRNRELQNINQNILFSK